MEKNELVLAAKEAAKSAYSPYSNFCVGAALLSESGRIYTGCNIENASYSVTCCAERVALFKAISENIKVFTDIAIVGGRDGNFDFPCQPCGVCRQALAEFCSKKLKIHLSDGDDIITYTLEELLPHSFNLNQKKGKAL